MNRAKSQCWRVPIISPRTIRHTFDWLNAWGYPWLPMIKHLFVWLALWVLRYCESVLSG